MDAAYSGDWSRIGAISKEQEAWLQSAVKALAVWHLLNGAAAFVIADQSSKSKLPATLKVRNTPDWFNACCSSDAVEMVN